MKHGFLDILNCTIRVLYGMRVTKLIIPCLVFLMSDPFWGFLGEMRKGMISHLVQSLCHFCQTVYCDLDDKKVMLK